MKATIVLSVTFFLFPFILSAQIRYTELQKAQAKLWKEDSIKDRNKLDKNSVTVFSDDNYKFTLFLNNQKQNTKPADEVKVEGLSNPFYDARIEFQDAKLPPLSKKIRVVTPQGANADVIYKIKYNDNGELILFFLCDIPVKKNALTYESGRRVQDISGGNKLYDYYDDKAGNSGNGAGSTVTTTLTTNAVTKTVADANTGKNMTVRSQGQGSANGAARTAPQNAEKGTAGYQPGTMVVNTIPGNGQTIENIQSDNSANASSSKTNNSFAAGTIVTRKVENIKDTNASYYYNLSDSATRVAEILTFNDSNTVAMPQEQFRSDVSDNDVAKFRCPPMEDSAFTKLLNSIPPKADDGTKYDMAEKLTANACLSCEQVLQICQLMSGDKTRLEFAEYYYPKVADPYNYRIVGGSMFNVKFQKKLQQFVAKYNR